jgi:hypothetical protein
VIRAGASLAALIAAQAAAPAARAELMALRCPMASMAVESLYEIDLAAKTVRLTNLMTPITVVASIDDRFVTWRSSNASFRLDRVSRELMQANSADGPWEITSFCVPL